MQQETIISVDAMGGDHSPSMVIGGIRLSLQNFDNVRYLLHGDKAKLEPLLEKHTQLQAVCEICHADEVILNETKPAQALRKGKNTSMWKAIDAVRDGKAHGVVSAGNTGALMAISKMRLKTLPGIHRPAIIAFLPTVDSLCVMLDLGGNTECSARNLVEFAIMGEAYARATLKLDRPRVGLLNIGSEEMKGRDEIREAGKILRESTLDIEFKGNVEAHDIGSGKYDVIVTDGFTGNVALKTVEGTSKLFSRFMKDAFKSGFLSKMGYLLARSGLAGMKERIDPRRYNGAMFVGLNGVAVKSHGGTDSFGFSTAIGNTIKVIRHGLNDRIKNELESVELPEN